MQARPGSGRELAWLILANSGVAVAVVKIVSGCATISGVGVGLLGGLKVGVKLGVACTVGAGEEVGGGVVHAELVDVDVGVLCGAGSVGVVVHVGSSVGVGVFTRVDVGRGVAVAGIAVGTAVGVSVAVEVGSGVAFGNRAW